MRIISQVIGVACVLPAALFAQGLLQLYNTNQLQLSRTMISFDDYTGYIAANNLYQNAGVTFSRDDGFIVPLLQSAQYGIQPTSGDSVLFSGFFPAVGPTNGGTTHIEVNSLQPLTEIGAFFGNDQYIPEFAFQRLSIYGAAHEFLGSVDVAVNNNASVDQFIGLRSGVPFHYARFENFDILGNVSTGYAVAIDNLFFSAVPEPSTYALFCAGTLCAWFVLRHRGSKSSSD